MKRIVEQLVLLTVGILCLAASSCYVASGSVGYGYGYHGDPYGDVFYSDPIDRYDYGFHGHP